MAKEHDGHRIRVRDRVSKEGLDNFQDYQVLEYLLTFVIPFKDTNLMAHQLINKFGSFHGVLEADAEDLKEISGIKDVAAHLITHLVDVFRFYEKDRAKDTIVLKNPGDAVGFVRKYLQDKLIEEMYLICVTAKNKIVSIEKVSHGNDCQSKVVMRSIIEKISRAKVSNIILAHNHPKGLPEPSDEDNKFTKAMVTNLALNGCHLLDHIIIADNGEYYSYRKSALIDKYFAEAAEFVSDGIVAQPRAKYGVEYD